MVGVHVRDDLRCGLAQSPAERVAEDGAAGEPVDRAEAADRAHAQRVEREVGEVMRPEIARCVRHARAVARVGLFELGLRERPHSTHDSGAPAGLRVPGRRRVAHEERHPWIPTQVLGVLGQLGEQENRGTVAAEREGRERSEGPPCDFSLGGDGTERRRRRRQQPLSYPGTWVHHAARSYP